MPLVILVVLVGGRQLASPSVNCPPVSISISLIISFNKKKKQKKKREKEKSEEESGIPTSKAEQSAVELQFPPLLSP